MLSIQQCFPVWQWQCTGKRASEGRERWEEWQDNISLGLLCPLPGLISPQNLLRLIVVHRLRSFLAKHSYKPRPHFAHSCSTSRLRGICVVLLILTESPCCRRVLLGAWHSLFVLLTPKWTTFYAAGRPTLGLLYAGHLSTVLICATTSSTLVDYGNKTSTHLNKIK